MVAFLWPILVTVLAAVAGFDVKAGLWWAIHL